MRVGIYARVSTADKGQTTENQLRALRQACAVRGWTIAMEESDTISGTKERRPGLDSLFAAAARQEFDTLVVWSLDRLTREGALRTLEIIQRLSKQNVGFYSLQEPYFDTAGPFRDAILSIAACLAKLEREKIVERVKAGLERTKAGGTKLGRPGVEAAEVVALAREGKSTSEIVQIVKIKTKGGRSRTPDPSTIRKILATHREKAA